MLTVKLWDLLLVLLLLLFVLGFVFVEISSEESLSAALFVGTSLLLVLRWTLVVVVK